MMALIENLYIYIHLYAYRLVKNVNQNVKLKNEFHSLKSLLMITFWVKLHYSLFTVLCLLYKKYCTIYIRNFRVISNKKYNFTLSNTSFSI